ncbi:acylneuraminate cytidylyltransferase family protein [Synechococcus sp. CC9311]|uniref:acylneuraminate cytidylyltransferase family protein n=1 Tax=Synechococcus sp. (strain CC9311) TaxID=64471 RepID=UPI0000DDA9BC|nr:acylneuraminate cytidylyltransferase family protein [Synechococcus sp. CC9311]ABI45735.1 CMP-N-acetylneuraminic acid synthetase [Synechococcus sp. CC9311]
MIDLAIIPARAGSKGLPGKNSADLGGYPLIAWTIRSAISANLFKRVVVTTDSQHLADLSCKYGAEVPFLRPNDLATSEASSASVIYHCLDQTGCSGTFAFLQPTSPFRNKDHIISAYKQFKSISPASSLISTVAGKPYQWCLESSPDQIVRPVTNSYALVSQRQSTKPSIWPNGAIYLSDANLFRASGSFLSSHTQGFEMSEIDSIDIDYMDQLNVARAIVSYGLRSIDK